ncbi:zinc finger and BTB domain-containing protein 41 [Syngnathus scovelli]|uniref:zinc finger and BTB domain-containing protein 41 n=1 Tax=Syngnathus scovelli TaxID=161590 RepID=UPI00210F63AA|nr:zinc finger and BTB domain-containing protein 41 [Syngnathus scovelli]XP_049602529.1 zinc finger and BTB domain-containing protein 41 [Syngnathus scovelli]
MVSSSGPMKKRTSNSSPAKHSRKSNAMKKYPTAPGMSTDSFDAQKAAPQIHLTMAHHSRNLLNFLNEDRTRQRFCDVSVSVCGKLYGAHKVVLAHGSSYFHAELSRNPAMTHVILDHVEDSVFQHLLALLYTSECVIAKTELQAVTEAAHFLDMMDVLKLLCEERLNDKPVSGDESESLKTATRGSIDQQLYIGTSSQDQSQSDAQAQPPSESQKMCGGKATTMRRSARRRKPPTKYEKDCVEYVDNTEETQITQSPREQFEERWNDEEVGEYKLVVDETRSSHAEDLLGEEDEEGPIEEGGKAPAAGPKYPEGLTPVITHIAKKKILKCPKCDKTFDRAGKYESHTRVHTKEKPFQCDICQQRYSTKSNLTVHKKKHTDNAPLQMKEHKCPFCNKFHASTKTLAKHVRRFHPEHLQEFVSKSKKRKTEGWKCPICLKSFTRRTHLQEHMILHTQDRPFKCAFCDEFFRSRFARLKHQEKYHLGPFPCEICGRNFNDTGNRRRHVECTHGGKRKWTCFVCGKSVRERTTLREHMRIHSGEKPHICGVCGQTFRHKSSYRLHLRMHRNDKRYECDECGKTFVRHDHLTKHQKTHSGEKAHQCEECGKCFRRQDHLAIHYRSVHLGEKVWQKYKAAMHQCEVCKKEFKGKSSLEMHFRTHSGEKPFSCPECHQTFRIKKTLTKHMVIHSDVRPFNCQQCNAAFKRKDKLKYHVDHVHSSRFLEQPTGQDKMGPDPFSTEPKSTPTGGCVADSLDPAQIAGRPGLGQLDAHAGMRAEESQPNSGYQNSELAFLEKYTLAPQSLDIVQPVRPDQMLDTREQTYLGTLLGLDSASSVANISNANQSHQ